MISGAVAGSTVTARTAGVVIVEARVQHPSAEFLADAVFDSLGQRGAGLRAARPPPGG
jgi:hypothetical protein